MSYIVKSNDGKYVKQTCTGFELTTSRSIATNWKNSKGAERIAGQLTNGKVFGRKKKFHVEHLFTDSSTKDKVEVPLSQVKSADTSFNVVDKAKDFITYASKLNLKKSELIEQLSDIEKEIVDIEHAIEFYTLNASEGYKMYKLLHDARKKRRSIKDEMLVIESLIPAVNIDAVQNIESKISSLGTRRYEPRTDKFLFKREQS